MQNRSPSLPRAILTLSHSKPARICTLRLGQMKEKDFSAPFPTIPAGKYHFILSRPSPDAKGGVDMQTWMRENSPPTPQLILEVKSVHYHATE